MNANRCVVCQTIIPEGRQVCPICARKTLQKMSKEIKYEF